MTLKSLFSKEFWTRLLRRFNQFNWLTAIWSVILFFVFPVAGALVFSTEHRADYWTIARVSNVIMTQSAFACSFSVLMAILTPNAFNYLNSRRELDFYHSQPVTRKELFWRNYFTGWMCFIIPLVAGFLCEMGIVMLIPGIGWHNFVVLFKGFFSCVGTYLSVNAMCLLAVMVCGNRFISLLTGVYFCGAPAMLFGLVYYYIDSFSATFRYESVMEDILVGASPLAYIFDFIGSSSDAVDDQFFRCGWGVIVWTVISVGVIFLARGLYLRRKSETAGKPLSFPKAIIFIKYPLTIFSAWVGGLLFEAMTGSAIWMLFAFVTFGIITHCIISGLEKFEFRNAFRGWLKLLLCAGIFLTCIFIIFIGCELFDRRTTKDENIVSIDLYSIHYTENANNGDYYNLSIDLEDISGEDAINALNTIAKIGAGAVTSGNGSHTGIGNAYAEVVTVDGEAMTARAYVSLYLRINTRIGSYTREYSFYTDVNGEVENALKKFISSAGARKSHAEYLLSTVETDVEMFSFRPNARFPSSAKMEELYNALKADMAAATAQQYEQKPEGYVTIHYSGRFYKYSDSSEERTVDIPVYSFYENTMALAGDKLNADNAGKFDTVGTFETNYWYNTADYEEGYKAGETDGYERGKDDASNGNGYYEIYLKSESEYDRGYYEGFIYAYQRGYNIYGDPYSDGYETGFEEGKAAGERDATEGYDITIPSFDYNGTDYRSGYIDGFHEGYYEGYKGVGLDTETEE